MMARLEYVINMDSDIDSFNKVIFTLSQLINDGDAKIIFGIEEDTQVEVDDKALSKYEIDKDIFGKIVNFEFISVLEAILSKTETEFIKIQCRQARNDNEDSKNNKDKLEKCIKSKIEYVKETIVNDEIQERFLIKSTTKHPKIKNIDWEINTKVYDKKQKELKAKYATISIKFVKELDELSEIFKMLPFIQSDYKIDEISFDCDEFDIEYIMKIFDGIRTKLKSI